MLAADINSSTQMIIKPRKSSLHRNIRNQLRVVTCS